MIFPWDAPASGKHEILLCVPICLIHSESCRIRMNFEQQPGRQGAFLSGGDMKRLLVTVKPFNGTIPFRVLQRGRVLVKDIFSGKCTECYSRTYEVDATDEEISVECDLNANMAGIVTATLLLVS